MISGIEKEPLIPKDQSQISVERSTGPLLLSGPLGTHCDTFFSIAANTFTLTINSVRKAGMIADAASELIRESSVERDDYLISGSEKFSFMLETHNRKNYVSV